MLAALTAVSDEGGGLQKYHSTSDKCRRVFVTILEMNNSMESPIIPQEDLTNIHLHT